MFTPARKFIALFLVADMLFSPILPAFAATTRVQSLPELGSTVTTSEAATPAHSPEWLLDAATDPDLAPSSVRPRSQGYEQAMAQGAGILSGAASEVTQSWFSNRHMTAELALKIDNKGVHGGSLDVLMPFYNVGNDLLFTQVGIRRANTYTVDYRNTVNLGVGYRHNVGNWLLGVNSFFDRDLTGRNDRIGVGAEAWTDFLKLSANSYVPLTPWQASPDREGYLERPAKGWDVRAEGYLPAYPQLGGKVVYEQYYGKQVSLFSANNRQQDPHAMTVGVIYNPVPMVSVGVNHRRGEGGLSDNSANLSFTYRIGESLAKQLSSDNLIASRMLENMRYNLVARNNEMVMDNREDSVQLRLPATLSVPESQTVQFAVTGATSLRSMSWSGSAAGFAVPFSGGDQGWLTMPAYSPAAVPFSAQPKGDTNTYTLQAIGVDKSGRPVTSNVMTVMVHSVELAVTATPASIEANGSSTTTLSATVKGSEGQAVGAGLLVNWTTSAGTLTSATSTTDALGVATVVLTSPTQVGTSTVEASAGSATGSATVTFTAGTPASGNTLSVVAAPTSITADGTSTTILSTTLKDQYGNLVGAGVPVNWTTTLGLLASPSTVTDSSGVATVVLTSSTQAGTASVHATAGTAHGDANVVFTPGPAAAGNTGLSLSLSPTSLPADGTTTTTAVASLVDAHGNPLGAGTSVSWHSTAGSLAATSSNTDANGKARVLLTSATVAGTATLTASAGAASNSTSVTFTAGVPAAGNSGMQLSATPLSITADGISTSTVSATVTDAFGNTLPAGVQVSWTTDAGSPVSATSTTNASGVATWVVTSSTLAGVANVRATSGAANNALSLTFTPGVPAAGSSGLSLSAAPSAIVANGSSTTTLSASVRDVHGNPVGAGVAVSWTTSAGTLGSGTSTTDASGIASMVLTSSTVAAAATVQASAAAAHSSLQVSFDPGAPAPGRQGLTLSVVSASGADTATLNATVKDQFGNRVGAGVAVTWSASAGLLGSATTTTDNNGVASVLLTYSGSPQRVTVYASSGAAADSATIAFGAGVPAVGSNGISLAVGPDDGSNTATISATLRDSYGDVVGAGFKVDWQTSLGSLSGTSSITNASGIATIVLTGSPGSSADITAAAGAATNSISVTFAPGTPASGSSGISLAATPPSVQADGNSTVTITATLLDGQGQSVGAGVTVNWGTNLGSVATSSSVTNSAGVATVVLTSATTAGIATVTASSGTAHNAVPITYLPGAAAAGSAGITVIPSATSITADGVSSSTLRAAVKDSNGNAVGAGITVNWTTDAGQLSSTSSLTDGKGETSVLLTSAKQLTTATVQATAGAAQNSATVAFIAGAPSAGNGGLSLAVLPVAITANGTSTATLSATVRDAQGFSVGAGVQVNFVTSAGILVSPSASTDSNGVASVTITSATLAGSATVRASAGAALNAATLTFTPGAPAAGTAGITLAANPAAIVANGSTTTLISATVVDAFNNSVAAGQLVTWTTSAGSLANPTSLTDANGVATMVLTSSQTPGTATVAAAAGAATASLAVSFMAGPAAAITVTPALSSLTANGTSTTTLTATVVDAAGNPVAAGTPVSWTTSSGQLASGLTSTNASGIATVVLTSSTVAGVATVEAAAGVAKGSTSVTYTAGPLARVQVTPAASRITADGNSQTTVSAVLTDANGNRLGSGETVSWGIAAPDRYNNAGTLSVVSSITDAYGVATVTITSARATTSSNANTITATARALQGTTTVTFIMSLEASVSPIDVPRGGQSTITTVARGADGLPVAGITVYWLGGGATTQDFALSSASSTTNAAGIATITVRNLRVAAGSSGMNVIGSLGAWEWDIYLRMNLL